MKNNRNDHVSKIMSKSHGIFTENFIISFSNVGKIGNTPEFEFDKF